MLDAADFEFVAAELRIEVAVLPLRLYFYLPY